MSYELRDYQRAGVDWLDARPRAFLADEPGLGKSAQLLRAAVEPILVVAPAMVLDSGVWDDEVSRWLYGAEVSQVAYSSLCAREAQGRATRAVRKEYRRQWGTVIADEAHYLKGRKTLWTAAFAKLRAERVYLASGTPLPNWAVEAFIPAKLLNPRDPRFNSYWRWAGEWFELSEGDRGQVVVGDLREGRTWEEFAEANWKDRMLRRLRADVLTDLPPLSVQQWNVAMTREQARVYRELRRDCIASLPSGETVWSLSNAGLLTRLAQVATGLEVLEPGMGESGKLNALRELLRERERPTFVVAHFRRSVEACARVAATLGKRVEYLHGGSPRSARHRVVRAFQAGELDVLCASIELVKEGMTLTAADQVIRVERSWRPSSNEQVVRRLHRLGQQRPVSCVDLVTQGSLDGRVLALLAVKTDQQMQALSPVELASLL